nr:MAG TPA: Lysosome-associated membrane glycoprotein 2 PROTEIN [Caudoviricetes sp.]
MSAGNAQNTALIPSTLLGIILAGLIHSVLLGYLVRRITPSSLL